MGTQLGRVAKTAHPQGGIRMNKDTDLVYCRVTYEAVKQCGSRGLLRKHPEHHIQHEHFSITRSN